MLAPCKSNNGPHILLCSRGEINQVQILVLGSCKSNKTMHLHDWGPHEGGITHMYKLMLVSCKSNNRPHPPLRVAIHLCGETCVVSCKSNNIPHPTLRVAETCVVSCKSSNGPDPSVCPGGKSLTWRNSCCFMPVQHWTRPICVFWGQITCVEKHMLVSCQSNTGPHNHLCYGNKQIMWRTEQVPYT